MKRVEMTGKNVLLNDDRGKESVMVRIPKFLISDVIPGGPDTVHPAFIVEGEEKECIYVSKYQNVVRGDRAYSLPGEDPSVLYTIEEAEKFCRDKGPGWHLMTSAEWAAVALWSQRNETRLVGITIMEEIGKESMSVVLLCPWMESYRKESRDLL